MSKNSQILQQKNYNQLLTEIKNVIGEIESQIKKQKIETAWQIGKLIDEHLQKSYEEKYGKSLLRKLESDLNIAQSTLYKMRSFYQTYPQKPQETNVLNWSHYSILISIKDENKRQELENKANEASLSVRELQNKATSIINYSSTIETSNKQSDKIPNLIASRGQLYSYPILNIENEPHIDLGFKIYRKLEEKIPNDVVNELTKGNNIITSTKSNSDYSLKPSDIKNRRKINIYKATLQRVVDGDTIRVILDLGFKIKHQEILRLRGINAAESKSTKGKLATKELKEILKNVPFLVIKTTATDIYGRYIGDVFLANTKDENPQQTANEGKYLNQILLDKGLAQRFM